MAADNERKPHICLYIGSLQKGGAERVMTHLAEYLYGEGWRVTFVTTYFRPPEYVLPHALWDAKTGELYGTEEETVSWGRERSVAAAPDGICRVYSDPKPEELARGRVRGFIARYRTLREIWKREKPDIILSFIGYNNSFAVLTSRGLGIPVAVSVRSNPAYEYNTAKLRLPAFFFFRKADGVVLQTHEAAEFFPKDIQKKAVILPNAINPDFIHPRYEGERMNRVVCVGRLDHNKNQDYLIRQFARAHEKHPEYTLHLYGDGPARTEFEHLADQLGIAEAVIFEGLVDGVREKIEKSRIFVLSSRSEGMPNALLEAMGAGLACISTDCPCGGPRDLIRDGENGFLVPVEGAASKQGEPAAAAARKTEEDPDSIMAERLIRLMDDPQLADRMGREAARVQESYSPERINRQWKDYLCSFIHSIS